VTRIVRVRPEAELDLLLAAGWYEAQRPGLGAEFLGELELRIASLADNALLYAAQVEGVRRVFARRFPYAVYYQLTDEDVVVLSVMHARRERPR
jgi:plasmid stabilization system protein ParE